MKNRHTPVRYIWQLPDWPTFTWDSAQLIGPRGNLNRLHGLLMGKMSLIGFENQSQTQLSALTEDLLNSSAIEGIVLNAQSVRSSIARHLGLESDGTLREDHYVEGLVNVMMDALTDNKAPLSEERLFGWHSALFPYGRSGGLIITVADWRKGEEPMQVVSGAFGHEKIHYQAPPSEIVPIEMEKFFEWCNSENHSPFIKAAIAHLWFSTIHPFDDGNGRIGRTITDMFLSRLDGGGRYYSMSAQINREKSRYYSILEETQKGTLDITPWLLWFFSCLKGAINRTLIITERAVEKTRYWEKHRLTEVNERQRKIINRLWDGFDGKLTTSKWAKICHCSQDTALRDINDLIAKNMLNDSGEKGRATNYILT